MSRTAPARRALILLLLAVAAFPTLAQTPTFNWNAGGSGVWSNPNNWSPIGVPTGTATVNIMAAGSYTVTLDIDTAVGSVFVGTSSLPGTQTLDLGGNNLSVTTNFTIDNTGQVNVGNGGQIGVGGGVPTLTVLGGALELENATLNIALANSGNVVVRGLCNITETLVNNLGGTVNVLGSSFGEGHLNVNNTGMLFSNQGTVTLDSETLGQDARITVNGSFNNQSGASLNAFDNSGNGGDRYMRANLTNDGTMTVQAPMILDGNNVATVNNSTFLLNSGGLTVTQTAGGSFTNNGSASIQLLSPAFLTVTGGIATNLSGTITDAGVKRKMMPPPPVVTFANTNFLGTLSNASLELVLDTVTMGPSASISNNMTLKCFGTVTVDDNSNINNTGTMEIVGNGGTIGQLTFNYSAASWTNNGTLNLTSLSVDEAKIEVLGTGSLNNNGTLQTQAGGGGDRTINAVINNQGTINFDADTTVNPVNASHYNGSTAFINANAVITLFEQTGAAPTFTNDGIINTFAGTNFMVRGGIFTTFGSVTKGPGKRAGGQLTLENVTLENSTINNNLTMVLINSNVSASATVTNNADLYLKGNVVWDGGLTNMAPSGQLYIEGTMDHGPGHLVMNNPWTNDATVELTAIDSAFDAVLEVNVGGRFTNNGTVNASAGSGGLRVINAELDNLGTINVNQDMSVNPPYTVGHTNSGPIMVNAAFLEIDANGAPTSTFTNNGGGNISIDSSASFLVTEGTFTQNGTLAVTTVPKRLPPVTNLGLVGVDIQGSITNDNIMSMAHCSLLGTVINNGQLSAYGVNTVTGTLTNNGSGTINIEANATDGPADLVLNVATNNAGNINLNDTDGQAARLSGSGTLTNAGTIETMTGLNGDRNISISFINNNQITIQKHTESNLPAVTMVNNGNIHVASEDFMISLDNMSSFTNNGSLTLNGGTLIQLFGGGNFDAASGTITSSVDFTDAKRVGGLPQLMLDNMTVDGTLDNSIELVIRNCNFPVTATLRNSAQVHALGTNVLAGTLDNQAIGELHARGDMTEGDSTLTIPTTLNLGLIELASLDSVSTATLNVTGTLTNQTGATLRSTGDGVAPIRTVTGQVVNNGTIQAQIGLNLSGINTDHSNNGIINIGAGSTLGIIDTDAGTPMGKLINLGQITTDSGAVISLQDSVFDNAFMNPARGDLTGIGSVFVNTGAFNSAGRLTPGLSPGQLLVNGDLTMTTDNITDLEINGGMPTTDYDQLVATGTINLAGTLALNIGFTPNEGDTFTVVSGATIAGTFDSITGAEVGNGLVLVPNYGATSVDLVTSPGGVQWTNAAGGLWSNPANWSTGQVPGPCSSVLIDLDGTYTVDLDAPVDIWSLVLGAASGTQTLAGNGHDIAVQDVSQIAANGVLELDGAFSSSATTCRSGPRAGFLGTPGLVNSGTIIAANATMNVSFGNAAGGMIDIIGSGGMAASFVSEFGFINDGDINLGDDGGGDGASLTVNTGELVNNGSLLTSPGGARSILAPIDNNSTLQFDANTLVDPFQVVIATVAEKFLVADASTLAHYRFDTLEQGILQDDSDFARDLAAGDINTAEGAVRGAVLLDGEAVLDLSAMRDLLAVQEAWTVSWFSKALDDQTPALQMAAGLFDVADQVLTDARWHHFALSFDGAALYLYRDGLLSSTATYGNSEEPGLLAVEEVQLTQADGTPLVGLLDELRFDGAFLEETDLQNIMEMVDIVNHWETATRLNNPEGIRQVWVDAHPVTVIADQDDALIIHSRLLDAASIGKISFTTHAGNTGEFRDVTLTPDEEAPHTWYLSGTRIKRAAPDFNNYGNINLDTGVLLQVPNGNFINYGTLTGFANIDVTSASFTNEGQLNPGSPIGRLHFLGNVTLGSTSTINIAIGGTVPITDYDIFNVSGNITLGGVINVSFDRSFLPSGGETFGVLNFGAPSGTLAGVNLPTNPPDVNLTHTVLSNSVVIEAQPVFQFSFNPLTYFIDEDDLGGKKAAFITVEKTGNPNGAGTVIFDTVDIGDATAGVDFIAHNETLSFAPGDTSQTVLVDIIDDRLIEGDESLDLQLSGAVGGTIGNSLATLTILDVEEGELAFDSATYNDDENQPGIDLTLTRSGGSDGAVSVLLTTSDGTAVSGQDYQPLSVFVNWADGDTTAKIVTVDLIDDNLLEGPENFEVTLTSPTGNAQLGTPAAAIVTINDWEEGQASLTAANFSVNENGAQATITVERINGTDGTLTTTFETIDGTATAGLDYSAVNQPINFPDGSTGPITVNVPIIDDTIYEGDEDLTVRIGALAAQGGLIQAATLTIVENDPPPGELQFSAANYSFNEGAGSADVEIVRVNGDGGTVTVDFETYDNKGGATPNGDYTPVMTTLTFADGVTSQTVSIPLLKDAVFEEDESFGILLLNPTGGGVLGTPDDGSVTIIDNDDPPGTLQLRAATLSVGEGDGTLTVEVERVNGGGGQVGVGFTTLPNGTATPALDYSATQTTITWADGETGIKTVSVPIIDDQIPEPDETFGVGIGNPTGGAVLGTPRQAVVTIIDNDVDSAGTIQFELATRSTSEGQTGVMLAVTRRGGSGGAVEVAVTSASGTATSGLDFGAVNTTVFFEDFDDEPKLVPVTVVDDEIAEADEQFTVNLAVVSGEATLGSPATSTITIRDNDRRVVRWASSGQTRVESNTTRSVMAVLGSASSADLSVNVEVSGTSTATAGSDYVIGNATINFPAGSTAGTLSLDLIDDNLVEGDEQIVLRLRGTLVDVGTPSRHTVVILDNDEAEINWTGLPTTVEEGTPLLKRDTTLVATAELSNPFQRSKTVSFNVGGSATPGLDYRAPVTQLIFPAGETQASATITLVDDNVVESDETLTLTLVGDQSLAVGADGEAEITIVDVDEVNARVNWVEAVTRVVEDDESKRSINVAYQFRLNAEFDRPVTITYDVAGLATPGEDHDLSPGSVTIPAGETFGTISHQILGDLREEPDENVAVRLSGGDVPAGSRDTHNVIIIDNDEGQTPDTRIVAVDPTTFRGNVLIVKVGDPVTLRGEGTDPQGDTNFSYQWEVCRPGGCDQTEGETIEITFPNPGTFRITCFASDSDGNADRTPAELVIQAKPNIPPVATISSPTRRRLDVPVGTTIDFSGDATDPLKRAVLQTRWFLQDIEGSEQGGTTASFTFDEPGNYNVVFEAVDDDGATDDDHRQVVVFEESAPTRVEIVSPADNTILTVGETFTCEAMDITNGAKRDHLDWLWEYGDGYALSGRVTTYAFSQPGRYRVRLFAFDDGKRVVGGNVTVFVEDPTGAPVVNFGFPTGQRLDPSTSKDGQACIFLSGLVLDDRGHQNLSFVYDVPDAQRNHETPGEYCFPGEGTYTISMYAVTPNGVQSDVVTRTIVVKSSSDDEFEPNDTMGTASTILPGAYGNLSVEDGDSEDYYRITIEEDGQRLVVKADVVGTAIVEVLDINGEVQGEPRRIVNSDHLTLSGLSAGDYFLHIVEDAEPAKRRGLSLSLSVGVLNPALYLPEIRVDASFDTSIGVVNPTGEIVCLEIVGFAADGTIIDEIPQELSPQGRQHYDISELFGDLAEDVAWIEVDSVGEVLGYSRTHSRDQEEVYAVTANRELSSELHAPHIAELTDQWYTRASVINGDSSATSAKVNIPGDSRDLSLTGAFVQDRFEFFDRFDGNLPAANAWATFEDEGNNATLAGVEIFGIKDGSSRVSAGLELSDVRRDNPNFTFVNNNLYFTHIARDDNFYTGIALVNLGGFEQGAVIHAYDVDGNEVVSPYTKILTANQKFVLTATQLLTDMGTTKDVVDWLLVEADADITGFEIFGSIDGKQMAGLEATRALRANICYPFLDTDADVAHGVSVVNVNASQVNVTFTLYNNNGEALGTFTETLVARQKFLSQLSLMFPDVGNGIPGWLEVRSDDSSKPLAGFELFLNTANGKQMGAVIAQ